MHARIQHIFSVDPFCILQDLGAKVTREGSGYFVPHPTLPNHRLFLHGGSLLSEAADDPVVACSVYDYLAWRLGTYEAAVDWIVNQYRQFSDPAARGYVDSMLAVFTKNLKAERQQFESIIRLSRLRREPLQESRLWCHHRGIDTQVSRRVLFLALRQDLENLVPSDEPLPGSQFVVVPYLADPHTFAWLDIYPVEGHPMRRVPLNDAPHAFFGLHDWHPQLEDVQLYSSALAAAAARPRILAARRENACCLHIASGPGALTNSFRLPRAVYLRAATDSITTVAQVQPAVEKLRVCRQQDYSPDNTGQQVEPTQLGLPWASHVVTEMVRILQTEGQHSPALAPIMQVLHQDKELCDLTLRYMAEIGANGIVAKLQARTQVANVYDFGALKVTETEAGYFAKRGAIEVPITNFTIQLDNNVVFAGLNGTESMHAGRLRIAGHEFPIVLPEKLVRLRPLDIPPRCVEVIERAGMLNVKGMYPKIDDNTLARRVGEVLRRQVGNCPTISGVRRLGWDEFRSRFTTPTWEARAQGIQPTSRIAYPFSAMFRDHYDFRVYGMVAERHRLTPQTNLFLCLLASMLARGATKMLCPPIEVLDSPAAVKLMGALFQPLGQKQPVIFGSQQRVPINIFAKEDLSAYPVYGRAANLSIVNACGNPVLLLAAAGLPFRGTLDNETYNQLAGQSMEMVHAVLLWCIRHVADVAGILVPANETLSPAAQIGEGARIIKSATGQELTIFQSDTPLLETILTQIAFEDLAKYFRYNMADSKLYMRLKKLPGVNRRALHQELVPYIPELELNTLEHQLNGPAGDWYHLLSLFYGRPVQLFHQEKDEETAPSNAAPEPAKVVSL